MKIKKGFEVRNMCGEQIVVAKGIENIDFSKIISLNTTAAYLWKAVEGKEFEVEQLAKLLTDEYEVEAATALQDAKELAEAWLSAGLVER